MRITIPELALVVFIGPSGAGKSTFGMKHFKATELLSSDHCRGLVSDDENAQWATTDAFDVLHFIAAKRLAIGKLTVVDATNVQPEARKPLVKLAREFHCLPVAIVFDLPERVYHDRNRDRVDRNFGPHVIRQQSQQLHRSLRRLQREGFRHVFVLRSVEDVECAVVERQPLWNNRKHEHGPFDIIGDVHGCYEELVQLLGQLGYQVHEASAGGTSVVAPPPGRQAIFLGDLVDRGPRVPDVLRLVMGMVEAGTALCVPGNHDVKLMRKLSGKDVQITHGLAESLAQLDEEPEEFRNGVTTFIDKLVSHYVLDDGKLVVAHAGMKESMQGRGSGKVREFALFAETTGETDEFGLPVRYNWAAEYRGKAMVVYGHTPVPQPEWFNRTINIDTGCVFGGRLTALRYPERELVSVAAKVTYALPAKPFLSAGTEAPALSTQQRDDDMLDLEDVIGKRIISTRLHHTVTIREENAIAALEVMSRFAINPKWLLYLPPTMSPSETSQQLGLLEHPADAFAYYRHEGIPHVICEEKHMGSRAVVVICRDAETARKRFGIVDEGFGACFTRTGRRFFNEPALEAALLDRIRAALTGANFWAEFESDWFCLDSELMPWSAKAQELVKQQYAAVGAAGRASLEAAGRIIEPLRDRARDAGELFDRVLERKVAVDRYAEAYRRYCWPVRSINDLKIAFFHLLASEGHVHIDKAHTWHMDTLAKLAAFDPQVIIVTKQKVIDVTNPASEAEGIGWWDELTSRGGEGMVVKPLDFVAKGRRGLIQPAVKCRGREYLRIIYGPEYTASEHLERLRSRRLGPKRSLALREFALGIEALERFVRREPLRRVHECVFGVLALESEPVDPRL
ncbi:MAG TPA: polynucleotide kinase-phosphatase [Chthoniobacterales bacterium]|jgi:protein phosphatase|nr:polynucleotide kinase-phosphatase [Chthoniobacterales bacterium]